MADVPPPAAEARKKIARRVAIIIFAVEGAILAVILSRLWGIFSLVICGIGLVALYAMLMFFISSFSKTHATYERPVYLDAAFLVTTLFLIIALFANFYRRVGLGTSFGVTHNLWSCLYFSVTTITTVGFGDYYPANASGRAIASAEALSGYFLLAFLANSVLDLLKIRR